jgi:hypothetical protein
VERQRNASSPTPVGIAEAISATISSSVQLKYEEIREQVPESFDAGGRRQSADGLLGSGTATA